MAGIHKPKELRASSLRENDDKDRPIIFTAADESFGPPPDDRQIHPSCGIAVMSFDGFLGVGESYHPLPWRALTCSTNLGRRTREAPRHHGSSPREQCGA
jgi:hypothetical protein